MKGIHVRPAVAWGVLAVLLATAIGSLAEAQQRDVTLTIFARGYTWDQPAPWAMAEAELQRRHPDIKFNFVEEGFGHSDLRTKFLTAAAGGNPPDVVQVDIIWLGEYVNGGLLRDLSTQATQWPEWMDTIQTFRDEATWNGKIYGSWLNTDVRVLAYNKTLFRQAGLDPNNPPKDWNELLADAKKVSDPPSTYGFEFPAMKEEHTAHRFFALLYSAGGQILNDSMTHAAFNSEAGVEALQFLVDMVKSGATPKSIVSGSPDDLDRGIYQGKFAMGIVAKTTGLAKEVIPDFSVEKYRQDFGVAPIPKAPGGNVATMSGGYLLSVPAGA
ncbi:MAG: extracellular solute-binding protein, partial [Deinococcales bacterium]